MEELDKAIVKAVEGPRKRQRVAATLRYSLRLYAQFLSGSRTPQYLQPRRDHHHEEDVAANRCQDPAHGDGRHPRLLLAARRSGTAGCPRRRLAR
jgi:hypothetical protein